MVRMVFCFATIFIHPLWTGWLYSQPIASCFITTDIASTSDILFPRHDISNTCNPSSPACLSMSISTYPGLDETTTPPWYQNQKAATISTPPSKSNGPLSSLVLTDLTPLLLVYYLASAMPR